LDPDGAVGPAGPAGPAGPGPEGSARRTRIHTLADD
jgi:hypothetical protein